MTRRAVRFATAVAVTALLCRLYARVAWPSCLLGWIAFVPWLLASDEIPSPWSNGVVMTAAFTLAVFDWFAGAVHEYTGYPVPAMLALLALGAPLLQPQIVAWAAARRRLRHASLARRACGAAATVVGVEWLAGGKLFGDTWGHGAYASPVLRQTADLGGAPLLTFAMVAVNESVASAIRAWHEPGRRPELRAAAVASVLVPIVVLTYGAVRLATLPATPPLAVAGLVQASLGDYGALREAEGTFGAVRTILDAYEGWSRRVLATAPLDVLVWPETAYPTTFGTPKSADGAAYDGEITAFVRAAGVPLVLGTYDAANGAEYNAAAFIAPAAPGDGRVDTYRKTQLFPLVERVPHWLDGDWTRAAMPWLGTWTPGAGPRVVALPTRDGRVVRWAPLICYDAVVPSLALDAARAGADALVALSNDGWFAGSEGAHLHLVVAAFRSIETGRAQVRATNSGISAILGPTGVVLAEAGVNERTTISATIPAPLPGTTWAVRLGDWVGPAGAIVAAVLVATVRRA